MSIKCRKCDRILGAEVLHCRHRKSGDCAFSVRKNIPRGDRTVAWSLILIGTTITVLTYHYGNIEGELSHTAVVLEILTVTILFLIGIFSFLIGALALKNTKTKVSDPVTKNSWEKHSSLGASLFSKIISEWQEIDWPLKFQHLSPTISKAILLQYKDKEFAFGSSINQIIEKTFSAALLNLLMQRYLKAYIAESYTVSGEELNSVIDKQEIFLSVNRPLPEDVAELELKIYDAITTLQHKDPSALPVALSEILLEAFNYDHRIDKKLWQLIFSEYKRIKIKKFIDHDKTLNEENDKIHQGNLDLLRKNFASDLGLLNSEIGVLLRSHLSSDEKNFLSKIAQTFSFKKLRIIVLVAAFLGFAILRIYLPFFRADQISKKIDNQVVKESIKGGIKKISDLKKLLNSEIEQSQLKGIDYLRKIRKKNNLSRYKSEIVSLLNNAENKIKLSTMELLESAGNEAEFAGESLLELLESRDPLIREKSIDLLSQLKYKPEVTIPILKIIMQNDPDFIVQLAAEKALEELSK